MANKKNFKRILSGLPDAELNGKCRNRGSGCADSNPQRLDKGKPMQVVMLRPKVDEARAGKKPVYVLKGKCGRCGWHIGRILSAALIKRN